jgi:hypothetical protein
MQGATPAVVDPLYIAVRKTCAIMSIVTHTQFDVYPMYETIVAQLTATSVCEVDVRQSWEDSNSSWQAAAPTFN